MFAFFKGVISDDISPPVAEDPAVEDQAAAEKPDDSAAPTEADSAADSAAASGEEPSETQPDDALMSNAISSAISETHDPPEPLTEQQAMEAVQV